MTTPDGLISHLYRPIEGRHYDAWLFGHSKLFEQMNQHAWDARGTAIKVYSIFFI